MNTCPLNECAFYCDIMNQSEFTTFHYFISAPICGSSESNTHLVGLDSSNEERSSRLGQFKLSKNEKDPHERQL